MITPKEAARASVRKELPQFPLDLFDRIASMYNTERDHKASTPAQIRDRMKLIEESAAKLYQQLTTLTQEQGDELFSAACLQGTPSLLDEARASLSQLRAASRRAVTDLGPVSVGADPRARTVMIRRLAFHLGELGLPVNTRSKGELVFLTGCVLEGYDEHVSDLRKLVVSALEGIG
jgi:hypothetical protein